MGCNKIDKLFVYELFRGWEPGGKFKKSVSLRPAFTKCNIAAKWIYLSKKVV